MRQIREEFQNEIQKPLNKEMILTIGTVGIYVENQDKAPRFWTEKKGFVLRDKKDMDNGMSWMEGSPSNAESRLVLYPKKLMPNFNELKPSVVFYCRNIENFCKELRSKGVVFSKELMQLPWGKFAAFLDEDGNEFGLREQPE